jgi:hypothetical protein
LLNLDEFLKAHGPCTGAELLGRLDVEVLPLWKACCTQPDVVMRRVGRRYLRLDRVVSGYARLSPSIRREFLTYTVVGLPGQEDEIAERCRKLARECLRVSQYKRTLARDVIRRIVESPPSREQLRAHLCAMIAGDVTYGMAHTVQRPEPSTGRPVRGSDLDVIIVSDEAITASEREALDARIYQQKWYMLAMPQFREEIDYVIKDVAKVRSQLPFDTLRHMIACKILHESEFLYGSHALFLQIKQLVEEFHIPDNLRRLEERAAQEREAAERQLLDLPTDQCTPACQHLFFTSDEREEIC